MYGMASPLIVRASLGAVSAALLRQRTLMQGITREARQQNTSGTAASRTRKRTMQLPEEVYCVFKIQSSKSMRFRAKL